MIIFGLLGIGILIFGFKASILAFLWHINEP